jgi:hypothetical protein|tara:strand:- start:227 stop:379 length:153 start_codon:yes stop_codon:yes gene_type:complete
MIVDIVVLKTVVNAMNEYLNKVKLVTCVELVMRSGKRIWVSLPKKAVVLE